MTENGQRALLASRLQTVEERLQAACRRSGRARAEVTLVAVVKTVSVETASLVPELGVHHLGESRPQELWHKAERINWGPIHQGVDTPRSPVSWHLIGHLQRNKLERTLPLVTLIHSVDSLRLLAALDHEAVKQQRAIDVLLEVNASGEATKHGFAPANVPGLVPEIRKLQQVRVRGLMTMAAPEEEPERCRPTFAALRQLRENLRGELGAPHEMTHLSMGMSNDFEIAVEEGATLVRLGSVLFEGL